MADADSVQSPADFGEAGEAGAPVAPQPPQLPQRSKARILLDRARAFLLAKIGSPSDRINLGRIAAIVTVPVFCWVFYTTSSGMIDIMRRDSGDMIGIIGAFIGTTAILVMLAATSWSLGADFGALIARRQFLGERIVVKTTVTSVVFVFVFSISAFFSFTYYYTNIFKLSSQKIVAELQPMELAADVLLPTSKAIVESYEAATARMLATPGMSRYLESLDAVLQTSDSTGASLREAMRRNQEALQRAEEENARKAAAELQEARAAARQLEEAQSKLARFERTIADLEPIIRGKQDEIASLTSLARREDQLAVDASKGLDGLGAACGANCESHRAKATAARKRIATIHETLTAPMNERAEAIRQRDLLAAQIITLRHRAESAAAARAPAAAPKEEPALDFAAMVRELSELRHQIGADPTAAKIARAKGPCSLLVATMRQLQLSAPGVSGDFACEPSGAEAHDLLVARDEILAGRAAFDQKCSLDGGIRESIGAIALRIRNTAESDRTAASNGFNEAKRIVDDCVVSAKAAGLPESEVQMLLKRSDVYLRTHSMDRNRFELAREAFASLTPDATMAIGVAVAQDAFMFVMKLLVEIFKREAKTREQPPLPPPMDLADSEHDEADVRLMKALLRVSRPLHGDMSAFDADAPSVAALPENVRDNLVGLLNRLVREEIAHIDRKGHYILDNRTLAEVETRLAAALKRAGARASTRREIAWTPEALVQDQSKDRGVWRRRRSILDRYLSPRYAEPLSQDEADAAAPPQAGGA
jgi:Skp family chaperone for outer membrane proteins